MMYRHIPYIYIFFFSLTILCTLQNNYIISTTIANMFFFNFILHLLIYSWGECSPFPDSMLHSTDESILLRKLQQNGYTTTSIPTTMQVSNNFSLHSLMPHKCNLSRIDSYTVSTQYGLVGFQSKTYTEEYFPQGKYYQSIEEYDKHCTCPYTRIFTWNPEANWTTLYSSEFLRQTNRMEVIHFRTLPKLEYHIPLTAWDQFHEMGEIDVIENIYLQDISAIVPIIISSFYETSTWVKWKLQVTHNIQENDTKPCKVQQDNLLISLFKQLPQNELPLCNASDSLKIQIVNKDTTKITIPGGIFRTITQKQKRSLIHLGIGDSNIFRWENWQTKNTIKTSTNYLLTIVNGPIIKQKKVIHFALENIQSYLMAIPDAMIHKNLQPENTLIAYHKGDQYCERISSAKIDMYNVQNINQKPYKNCHTYHNNTETCQKCKNHTANMQ